MQRLEVRLFPAENKCRRPDAGRGLLCLRSRERAHRKEIGEMGEEGRRAVPSTGVLWAL